MRTSTIAWVLAGLTLAASPALAQDKMQPIPPAPGGVPTAPPMPPDGKAPGMGQAPAPAPAAAPDKPIVPPPPPFSKPATWSNSQVEHIGTMLEGV